MHNKANEPETKYLGLLVNRKFTDSLYINNIWNEKKVYNTTYLLEGFGGASCLVRL